jgi:hypothetical protein
MGNTVVSGMKALPSKDAAQNGAHLGAFAASP